MKKIGWKAILIAGIIIILAGGIMTFFSMSRQQTSDNNQRLASELQEARYEIVQSIAKRYSFVGDLYEVERVVLLEDGYAVALLSSDGSTHRVVLRRGADGWKIYGPPAIILSYADYTDVPQEVLKMANDLEITNNE